MSKINGKEVAKWRVVQDFWGDHKKGDIIDAQQAAGMIDKPETIIAMGIAQPLDADGQVIDINSPPTDPVSEEIALKLAQELDALTAQTSDQGGAVERLDGDFKRMGEVLSQTMEGQQKTAETLEAVKESLEKAHEANEGKDREIAKLREEHFQQLGELNGKIEELAREVAEVKTKAAKTK